MDDFRAWLKSQPGVTILPPTKHDYEVLRFKVEPSSVVVYVYRHDRSDHMTIQAEGVPLMHKFLRERSIS